MADIFQAGGLTVGQVSGIIAAGGVIVKLFLPNLFALSFLGTLREREGAFTTNAVSWSVIGTQLHASLWPSLLRTDSAASTGVLSSVRITRRITLFTALLVAITAVVTPLGLYEDILPESRTTLQQFHYIADTGIFGEGTMQRNNSIGWSRICGGFAPVACPDSDSVVNQFSNASGAFDQVQGSYDTYVPQRTIDLFQSGVPGLESSVSGPFDIQWRLLTYQTQPTKQTFVNANNNSNYAVGSFRSIASLALDNRFEVIEGLVVDTVNGSIGFRNHTAPPLTTYGSTWQEDLLFWEPLTQCVDTNLTFDYEIPANTSQAEGAILGSVVNIRLVDHGGFVNLAHKIPQPNFTDTQANPDLWTRAYTGAWWNNLYTMAFIGIANLRNGSDATSPTTFQLTNSTLGQEYPFVYPDGKTASINIDLSRQAFLPIAYSQYLWDLDQSTGGSNLNITGVNTTLGEPALFPNPLHINQTTLFGITTLCQGAAGQDYANITNLAAYCGLVLGVPTRKDGVQDLTGAPGSTWTTAMYSCTSVIRANIKTVSFSFNNTDSLAGLSILDIQPKQYASKSDMPIWAVEDTQDALTDVTPLWGIVSSDHVGATNLSTVQSEDLYLPGSTIAPLSSQDFQNLPSNNVPSEVLEELASLSNPSPGILDYTGMTNFAMLRRWQNLSASAETMGHVLDLISTDLLANALVGTKSLLVPLNGGSLQKRAASIPSTFPVTQYQRKIKYHLPYAVPAILTLSLLLAALLVTCCAVVFGRTSAGKMRRYLNATSAGRIMTAGTGMSSAEEKQRSTSAWIDTDGRKQISAGNGTYSQIDLHGNDEGGKLLKGDVRSSVMS